MEGEERDGSREAEGRRQEAGSGRAGGGGPNNDHGGMDLYWERSPHITFSQLLVGTKIDADGGSQCKTSSRNLPGK